MSNRRLELLPYGSHTYSKADSRWWPGAPVIASGKGGVVRDEQGREYVDWGMGINNVLIGHAEDAIDDAAVRALRNGQAFSRPSCYEEQAAEAVLGLYPYEQIIFTKSGSSANDAAIKLARAVTGRQFIAYDGAAPFFSTSDWWCSHQPQYAGTLDAERAFSLPFRYNDSASLQRCFEERPLACVILEACRYDWPNDDFVQALKELCRIHDTLLVVDEVVTGYRYGLHGAAPLVGLEPDLVTLGKGMANGYAVAALCGRREYMRRALKDVFLLSTTNGAESSGLAAAIATAALYRSEDCIGRLTAVGRTLADLVVVSAAAAGADVSVDTDFPCRPRLVMSDEAKRVFYPALASMGVLMPPSWCCPCVRRTDDELERTAAALRYACQQVARIAA